MGAGVSNGTALYLLGLCRAALGQTAEAESAFRRAADSKDSLLTADGPPIKALADVELSDATRRPRGPFDGRVFEPDGLTAILESEEWRCGRGGRCPARQAEGDAARLHMSQFVCIDKDAAHYNGANRAGPTRATTSRSAASTSVNLNLKPASVARLVSTHRPASSTSATSPSASRSIGSARAYSAGR